MVSPLLGGKDGYYLYFGMVRALLTELKGAVDLYLED